MVFTLFTANSITIDQLWDKIAFTSPNTVVVVVVVAAVTLVEFSDVVNVSVFALSTELAYNHAYEDRCLDCRQTIYYT